MKFRPHRGTLAESMAECVDLEPTAQAIADHYNAISKIGPRVLVETIRVEPYGKDDRIGWDTYLVTEWLGVLGFTDGPLT